VELTASSYGLSLLAGVLSTLSPCVLPLVPILLGSAAGAHRLGPVALVGGLMLSFTAIGVGIASLGVGLEQDSLRMVGGVLLLLFGAVLVSTRLQEWFSVAVSSIGMGQGMLARFKLDGLHGQFLLGLLLGVVWSPCVGPTLGVAITLASQGQALAQVAAVMLAFSLGAALPLLTLGLLSRQALVRWRGRMLAAGQQGRRWFGIALLLIGMLVLTGADKGFETWALDAMPEWMVIMTTRY
jgi:cytochrome c biogenesis protein CcdA